MLYAKEEEQQPILFNTGVQEDEAKEVQCSRNNVIDASIWDVVIKKFIIYIMYLHSLVFAVDENDTTVSTDHIIHYNYINSNCYSTVQYIHIFIRGS